MGKDRGNQERQGKKRNDSCSVPLPFIPSSSLLHTFLLTPPQSILTEAMWRAHRARSSSFMELQMEKYEKTWYLYKHKHICIYTNYLSTYISMYIPSFLLSLYIYIYILIFKQAQRHTMRLVSRVDGTRALQQTQDTLSAPQDPGQ